MKENKVKILDSNILLDYPQIITKANEYWVIPMCVLREIDGLKMATNPEISKKARKAAVYISKNMDNIEWIIEDSSEKTDQQLLNITKNRNGILITNDVALKVQATVKGIETEGYSWNEDYTGIYYLREEDFNRDTYQALCAELYETGKLELEDYTFSINEYLIVPPSINSSNKLKDYGIFKFDGEKFNTVRGREIENSWCGSIYPRNPEQVCLVDLLLNDDIKILYAGGVYGSGKTILTHNYAIRELEREQIKKIVYVPNNAYTQNSMELGFLPGC